MMETKEILLSCADCGARKHFCLTAGQLRGLAQGEMPQFYCRHCISLRRWRPTAPLNLAPQAPPEEAERKNILVVDDDDLTLQLLQKILEADDVHIEMARNGKEALHMLASRQFQLVICDIRMPEMRGEELFRHVRENALLSSLEIIFLTGDESVPVRKFLDSSGCSYLYKPIQILQLYDQVQAALMN